MGVLQLVGRVGGQQQQERGAQSVRSSLNIAPSVYSQGAGQHDDGLTDAELEFYSIAGDSEQDEDREQQLPGLGGSPHSVNNAGDGSGQAAEEQDAWLHGWDLLPLAGFGSRGCQVAASWLLLSLSTAAGASAAGADGCPSAAVTQQHPALTLDVWQDMLTVSQQGSRSHPVQRQVTDVSLAGLQLQLSSKHWDLVAACILQAANAAAAKPAVAPPQPVRRAAPRQQQQLQQQQGRLSQLHLGLQELQVVLFVPPDVSDAFLQQPRMLRMCSSSGGGSGAHRDGHSSRVLNGDLQAGQPGRTSSEGFGPWQDPGSEPTTPTAAAGLGSGQAQHLVLPVGAGGSSSSHLFGCAAQTVTLKLSVELDMQLPAAGRPASLQQLHVPTACVQLSAAWDPASGRVCVSSGTAVPGPAPQQEQLLLLLAQGMRVTAGSPATGPLPAAGPLGQHLQVRVSSVSGWVSTTRLTLLLNIQQQLMQQLPAITAAAAMGGPSSNAYAAPAAAAGSGAAGHLSRSELSAAMSLTSSASLMNGQAVSSARMRRRSMEQQQPAGPRLVLDSSIAVAVERAAILVSTDEPEPWLLQQQQLSPGRGDGSPVSYGLAAPAAGSVRSPGARSGLGRLAAPSGYAPLSTCSTPLVEVALLPLDLRLQLLKPCGSRKGAAGQTVIQVDVAARLRADVYSVDKLGWEPVLDPWAVKVRLTRTAELKRNLSTQQQTPYCLARLCAPGALLGGRSSQASDCLSVLAAPCLLDCRLVCA
jgi:hypothetical protein